MARYLLVTGLTVAIFGTALFAQTPAKVDYRRDVQPIFKQNCIGCHGPAQQMNGFRLDQRRYGMPNRIGANGARIIPGSSDRSILFVKISSNRAGPQMPPTGALSDGEIGIIKRWIDEGAEWPDDSNEVAKPAPDPKTLRLIEALRKGDGKTVQALIPDAQVINKKDVNGSTPLMYAALYGRPDLLRMLLDRGADANLANDSGSTALMWAIDDVEKTRLLIEHSANVNAQSADGRTPLMIAVAQTGAAPVVNLLLDHGAKADAKSSTRATALTLAAPFADETVLKALQDHGGDVKSNVESMISPILRTDCRACLELLLPFANSKMLGNALAALEAPLEELDKVKLFLDRGADVHTASAGGQTALMTASYSDHVPAEAVRLLLEHGADLNARNTRDQTALYFAQQKGHTAVVDLLLQAGGKAESAVDIALPKPSPAISAREAVKRSLPLLQRADVGFFQKSGCISCHNNSLTSVTLAAARKYGFSVDEGAERKQVRETAVYAESWRERILQGIAIPGGGDTISYMLLGLAAGNYPADEATDAMARYLKLRQSADGRWRILANRPPLESSDIEISAVSLRALQTYAPMAKRADYNQAIQRAVAWLATAQPRTNEERAFQLLGLAWGKGEQAALARAARELIAQQRPDGGWSQLTTLGSDAYATGQALVALKDAGAVRVSDLIYKRGVEFLLKSQFEDGSWHVKSRTYKIQPYFESGFPHGDDQWISAAGTNWATMALAAAAR